MSLLSLVAPACAALGIDPLEHGLQLLHASALLPAPLDGVPASVEFAPSERPWSEIQGVGPYTPPLVPFPLVPTRPALICRIETIGGATLQTALLARYPADHPVTLVSVENGVAHEGLSIPLGELADAALRAETCAFVAPLAPLADLRDAGPAFVVARLLGPRGCPWDREQTHTSLRRELLAETHEVLEAIDEGDTAGLAEELGDLLLQVLMHAELGRQAGEFSLGDVHQHIAAKLIRRHPHVFGSTNVEGTADVLRNWDAIKQAERAEQGKRARGSLDGIPVSLPALLLAQETVRKAVKAGFEADDANWTWRKIHEEIDELEAAASGGGAQVEEELGDLLLALAIAARRMEIDAESALRAAVGKFRGRFAEVERLAEAEGQSLAALPAAAKEVLWQQAKRTQSR